MSVPNFSSLARKVCCGGGGGGEHVGTMSNPTKLLLSWVEVELGLWQKLRDVQQRAKGNKFLQVITSLR